jgi:hypothetical protein
MLRRVALVRIDISEELSASFIRMTRIRELGKTLPVRLVVRASVVPISPILVTLMKEALSSPKRRFLQEPHGVTSQKTPLFNKNTAGRPDYNFWAVPNCSLE